MKLSKILAGASLAALMASNANALGIAPGNSSGALGTNIDTPVALALESVYVAGDSELSGVFELNIDTTGLIAEGSNLILGLELQGGSFSETLDGSQVTDGPAGVTGAGIGGSNVIFGESSGLEGEDTVAFLISFDEAGNNFGLELPIAYDGCDEDLGIVISLRTEAGTLIEEGVVSVDGGLVTCVNAFEASVTDDRGFEAAGEDFDSVLTSLSNFTDFEAGVASRNTNSSGSASATGFPSVDTATVASFGVATVEFNPDATTRTIVARLDDGSSLLGNEGDDLTFTVTLEDDTNVVNATMGQGNETGTFASNEASVIVSLPTNTAGIPTQPFFDTVDLTLLATAANTGIASQDVVASDVVLTFSDSDLVASEAATGGTLDDLNFEGVICGPFDWFGDAEASTLQVIRATGYGEDVSGVQAIVEGATNPADDVVVDLDGIVVGASETIVTNIQIGGYAGDFNRANVSLNFVGASSGLDCDRLQISTASNVVTPFGNGTATTVGVDDGDDN